MKSFISLGLFAAICGLTTTHAALFVHDHLDKAIPDNNLSGVSDVQTVTMTPTAIQEVTLTLTIAPSGDGAFNGDYYAYLTHDSGFTVLLNRPGRRTDNLSGYGDSGFNQVLFDDNASLGDAHVYRLTLFGSHSDALQPVPSPLTGTWAPDGRNVAPGTVLDTDSRTATLASFQGLDPSGNWTLFVADVSPNGTASLQSWSLEITAVPEPSTVGSVVGLVLLGFALCTRKRFRTR